MDTVASSSVGRSAPGEYEATLNGLRLWYKVVGTGPVCLAPSPAWGASTDYLFRSLTPMEEHFTGVYLDSRGTGRSAPPATPEEYDWPEQVSDLDALRHHLHQEKVWLMGHSMAGVQVLHYALAHPQRVAGLILLDTYAAEGPEWRQDVEARLMARQNEPWYPEAEKARRAFAQTAEEFEQKLRGMLPFYFADQRNIEPSAAAFQQTSYSIGAWQGNRSPFDLLPRLPEIEAPTLIVVGVHDFICSPRQAELLHFGIANSKLLVIENAGHFPWMEQPEAFYAGIRRFLDGPSHRQGR